MLLKKLPSSKDRKNLTIRLDTKTTGCIRDRASELDMSQSYYIAALVWLDENGKLIETLGDPFAVIEDLSTDNLKAKIAELQAELARITNHTLPLPPEPAQPQPSIVPPPMRTIQDLVKLQSQGVNIANPPVTQATVNLRNELIKQQKEDQAERERLRQIVEE